MASPTKDNSRSLGQGAKRGGANWLELQLSRFDKYIQYLLSMKPDAVKGLAVAVVQVCDAVLLEQSDSILTT